MPDYEKAPERLDPNFEQAIEAFGPEVMGVIDQVSERYNIPPAKVVALGVISLYNQLNLRAEGKVVLVVDATAVRAYDDPIEAIAAQDSSGIFREVLERMRSDNDD